MKDIYLIDGSNVLKNKLNITQENDLDLAEAELSKARMMMLYDIGFDDFSSKGIQFIHKFLFGDVYDWAGEFRKINISKREEILAGVSVWYSNVTEIEKDLNKVWGRFKRTKWDNISKEKFIKDISRLFPALW